MVVTATDYQRKVILLAKDIIEPYRQEISYGKYCFEASVNTGQNQNGQVEWECDFDHRVSESDNYVCLDEDCRIKKLKELQAEYPLLLISSSQIDVYNDYDIDHCSVCGKALGDQLSSPDQEFFFQKENSKSKEDIICNAIEIAAVFGAINVSETIEQYTFEPESNYKKRVKLKRNLLLSYAAFAKRVINILPITKAEIDSLEYIGGLWTIRGAIAQQDIYFAKYITHLNGETIWAECFLLGDYHTLTIEDALAKKAQQDLQNEEELIGNQQFEKNKYLFYCFGDSIVAGNCEIGTLQFISRAGLCKDYGYRGDFLLELAGCLGVFSYVKKMIQAHGRLPAR